MHTWATTIFHGKISPCVPWKIPLKLERLAISRSPAGFQEDHRARPNHLNICWPQLTGMATSQKVSNPSRGHSKVQAEKALKTRLLWWSQELC